MSQGFHAVDTSTRIDFKTSSNEVNQLWLAFKYFLNCFQAYNIFNVFDFILVDVAIPE